MTTVPNFWEVDMSLDAWADASPCPVVLEAARRERRAWQARRKCIDAALVRADVLATRTEASLQLHGMTPIHSTAPAAPAAAKVKP